MACEHKRLKSVNCVLYCAECGARIDNPAEAQTPPTGDGERVKAEKPRRTRRKTTSVTADAATPSQ